MTDTMKLPDEALTAIVDDFIRSGITPAEVDYAFQPRTMGELLARIEGPEILNVMIDKVTNDSRYHKDKLSILRKDASKTIKRECIYQAVKASLADDNGQR